MNEDRIYEALCEIEDKYTEINSEIEDEYRKIDNLKHQQLRYAKMYKILDSVIADC